MNKKLHILVLDDNPGDAQLLIHMLKVTDEFQCTFTCCQTLKEAVDVLMQYQIDLALVDLGLPDSDGLDTVRNLLREAPGLPQIVTTGLDNVQLATEAVRKGAQDYLVKGQITTAMLVRAIQYAIERHQLILELRAQSLRDELTGLYNRRGFMTVAEEHLKFALRTLQGFFVVFIDLDKLKSINDRYGHDVGDEALVNAAITLRQAFRESDIIARFGGDEFAVLARDTTANDTNVIEQRIRQALQFVNDGRPVEKQIDLSVGFAFFVPESPASLTDLLAEADKAMYKKKMERRSQNMRS